MCSSDLELHNADPAPLNLAGYHLTDDPQDLTKWTLPAITLDPDGYLVLFASNKDRDTPGQTLHTNFRLAAEGEYLALVAPDGATIVQQFISAGGVFPEQFGDISYGLTGDGLERYFLTPTPGAANNGPAVTDPSRRILINEIMYHPVVTGSVEQPELEFIELYNGGVVAVDLTGWSFDAGVSFTFGAVTMLPGQYRVVSANPAAFAARWPGVPGASVHGPWTGRLSNSGERIHLIDAAGNEIDEVRYADSGDWALRMQVNGPADSTDR